MTDKSKKRPIKKTKEIIKILTNTPSISNKEIVKRNKKTKKK